MSVPAQPPQDSASPKVKKSPLFSTLKNAFNANAPASAGSVMGEGADVDAIATDQAAQPTTPTQPIQQTLPLQTPEPVQAVEAAPIEEQVQASEEPANKEPVAEETVENPPSPLPSPPAPPLEVPMASVMDSAIPLAVQASDTLNPPHAVGGSVKEVKEPMYSAERPGADTVPGVQYVEQEVNHEMSPEVESFISKVEDHQEQIPQEIVVGDQVSIQPNSQFLAQPVIVLPITKEVEKAGEHKSPTFSVRWLVEWSHKVMKVFSGRVVYKQG